MAHQLKTNRFRRSCCELCEPRQMLSVAPAVSLETQLVEQSYQWQAMPTLSLSASQLGTSIQGIDHLSGAFISIDLNSVIFNGGNEFGSLGLTRDWLPSVLNAIPMVNNAGGPFNWPIAKPPQLDPIAANPPGLAPVRIAGDDAGVGASPTGETGTGSASGTASSSSATHAESPTVIFAAQSIAVADSARPKWLSASFTTSEEHRLDATTVNAHFERTIAARDLKSRFALEPTRLICQTFYAPAMAPSVGQEDAAELPVLPAPKAAGGDDATRAIRQSVQEPAPGTARPAIHDAAIVDWDLSQAAILAAPATPRNPQGADQPAAMLAAREELDELEAAKAAPDSAIVQFLNENKYVAGLLFAALAARSIWSQDARPEAQSPGAVVKLLRKRIPGGA
jgi:hypothetical protein